MCRIIVLPIVILFLISSVPHAVFAEEPILERIEWTDVWVVDANKEDLPRVLMVGDSIVKGYYSEVEKRLDGQAHCARYATSLFMGNPDYLIELKTLLERYHFSVIHINNGLHGWGYSEKQYDESFPALLDLLAEHGKDAAIIWGTTTPVRAKDLSQFSEKTERVKARNEIAKRAMERVGIEIDDLYSLVESKPEWYSQDGTHFNPQGNAALGGQVAQAIEKHLPKAK